MRSRESRETARPETMPAIPHMGPLDSQEGASRGSLDVTPDRAITLIGHGLVSHAELAVAKTVAAAT